MNAEPLDIYLDALDAADREHFPPCCAECRFAKDSRNGWNLYCSNWELLAMYVEPDDGKDCDHYEPKSPSDGLEDIY